MAYNQRNILEKIIDIQNVYLDHNKRGVSGEYIYTRIINPVYRISRSTFYKYLAMNAKKMIKDFESKGGKKRCLQ